jgi:hypothetical protein
MLVLMAGVEITEGVGGMDGGQTKWTEMANRCMEVRSSLYQMLTSEHSFAPCRGVCNFAFGRQEQLYVRLLGS